jgi:hypothetical protein
MPLMNGTFVPQIQPGFPFAVTALRLAGVACYFGSITPMQLQEHGKYDSFINDSG